MKSRMTSYQIIAWMAVVLLMAGVALPIEAWSAEGKLDAAKIGQAAGMKATTTPDGVVRLAWARTDVPVKVDGLALDPFAGLGAWAAFTSMERGAMVMSDTVVFQDEVNPAMDAAFAAGLEVTALHNHFFFDEPKVYFMHLSGHGQPEQLAVEIKSVWDAIKKVRAANPAPAAAFAGGAPQAGTIDAAPLEKTLGPKPEIKNGVVKFTFTKKGEMHGTPIGGSMGLTTWAAFSGSNSQAVADGDFIMTAGEVQPVLHALRKAGINIVALHNHMIGEKPGFIFTHFWGKGTPEALAQGIKSALDAQRAVGQGHGGGKM